MEGYLHLRIAPWLRRLVTRLLALIPAVVVIALAGESATQHLLVLSQVILSLQLSFAVIPLIHFTSNRRNMGAFATPWWGQVLAWLTAAIIVALNGKLVLGPDRASGSRWRPSRGRGSGRCPRLGWWRSGLYGLAGAVALPAGLGDDQAVGPSRRRPGRPSRASSSTGSMHSGPGRWRRSAWPWSTTRPTPRSSTAPSAWPSPAGPAWSCSTSSTRR